MVAAKLPVDDKITARVKQICLLDVVCKVTRSIKKAKSDYYTTPLETDSSKSGARDFWRDLQCTSTKDAVDVITPSLTALFNLSPQTRSFPSVWETAKVIPCSKRAINRMLLLTGRSPFCRP